MTTVRFISATLCLAAIHSLVSALPALAQKRLPMQIDGIYGGFESIPPNINSTGIQAGGQVIYVAFFPDGRLLWGLPPEGLNGLLPSSRDGQWKDDWGRYTVSGNSLRISLPHEDAIVATWDGKRLQFDHSRNPRRRASLVPWPRLSGRALEGTYRRAPDYPGIRFTTDNHFVDDGFQSMLGTISTVSGQILQPDAPGEAERRRRGTGTFSLKNYTLELRYDDGRIVQLPLLVAPGNAERLPVASFEVFGQEFTRM